MRKRKEYRLTEEAVDVINMTKAKMNLLTGSDALCYIVEQYARMEGRMLSDTELKEIGDHVVKVLTEEIGTKLERIRLTSTLAEKNTALTMDAVNTMLYAVNADFLMRASGATMHEVLRESEQRYEERAAHNKQIYDNRYIGTDRKEQK